MIHYALFSYTPRRYWRRTSFEQQDICRMILGFKDGRNVYTRWAVREVSKVLADADMSDVVVICTPAHTHHAHVRRWKRFSGMLCDVTGAVDGFDSIQVSGNRRRAHVTGEYELRSALDSYVHIDADRLRGRRVLVIDDIYTTGQSSAAFIEAVRAAGADVMGALFLARTIHCRSF